MNKRNELEAYTIEGSVDSAVVIHVFNEFCKTIEGPTVVVVDNASIHRSEAFQEELPMGEKEGLWAIPFGIRFAALRMSCYDHVFQVHYTSLSTGPDLLS